jgi:hypothetical protein
MRVNCPSCQEQIEIPRSTGSQPPKVPVSATVPPIPALPPRIPPHMKESTMPDSARTLIRSRPILRHQSRHRKLRRRRIQTVLSPLITV